MPNGTDSKASVVIPEEPPSRANINGVQLRATAYGTVVSTESQLGGQQLAVAYASVRIQYGVQPMAQKGSQPMIFNGALPVVHYDSQTVPSSPYSMARSQQTRTLHIP
jgi:hypothetical protein